MKKYLFFMVLFCQISFSQNNKIEEITQNLFHGAKNWQIPLSKKENLSVFWQERKTSFTEKEGIRSFAGYVDNQLIGAISIQKNSVFGNISWNGNQYIIYTKNGKISVEAQKLPSECGLCKDDSCHANHHHDEPHFQEHQPKTQAFFKNMPSVSALNFDPNRNDDKREIYTDGVLRFYRFAILVDYSAFQSYLFNSDVARVKAYWASAEVYLNEIYYRDIGVKMILVNDEKLIRQTPEQEVFPSTDRNWRAGTSFMTSVATDRINKIIGVETYDIGGVMATSTDRSALGLGDMHQAYGRKKASVYIGSLSLYLVAHEFGHMFGSFHTFTRGGTGSMLTEPDRGQSVMSYGQNEPRDFFSLPSIYSIRNSMAYNTQGYYTNPERTQYVGALRMNSNTVYGKKTNNRPPILDVSRLKKRYTLPKETYFQFRLKASDPDGHSLLYMAHQADINRNAIDRTSKAIFRPRKASPNNLITFIPEYKVVGNSAQGVSYVAAYSGMPLRDYTFWLAVSDGDSSPAAVAREDHAVMYDMFETKVNYVEGTPFKITGGIEAGINGKTYSAGQKITLKWNVDKIIFGNDSKVRILLSDDLGETYNYVLIPETENDGEAEITLPNIEIGKKRFNDQVSASAGMIKIEVIDHIAVAITENNPALGGFEIRKSQIELKNLPPQNIEAKSNAIPEIPNVTAVSSCVSERNPQVKFSENKTEKRIERTWSATDTCGNSALFTQFIEVKKNVEPLKFSAYPADMHLHCPQDYKLAEELKVSGGTSPKVEFQQTRFDVNDNKSGFVIKRTWTATDPDADPITHTQTITVYDGEAPKLSEYPKDIIVKSWAEAPPLASITATDNCAGSVAVQTYQGSKPNDEQGRERIYYSWFAKDIVGNETYHEQIITLDPNHTQTPQPAPIAPLQWAVSSLPEIKISCKNEIPTAKNPATIGGKGRITITHTDTTTGNDCNSIIIRTYTATDEENTSKSIQQTIKIEDKTSPTWENIATLPQNITIEEGDAIPTQMDLTATDNCGTANVVKSSERNGNEIIYIWIATDTCGNEIKHQQVITIKPKIIIPNVPNTPNNLQNEKIIIYNGVSTQENSENYLRINDDLIQKESISVEIFNEMGQRVYKNDHYGKKGDVFRGYANEKGVFRKEKPLPSGTYFYIMNIKNEKIPVKRGYLYVK